MEKIKNFNCTCKSFYTEDAFKSYIASENNKHLWLNSQIQISKNYIYIDNFRSVYLKDNRPIYCFHKKLIFTAEQAKDISYLVYQRCIEAIPKYLEELSFKIGAIEDPTDDLVYIEDDE